MLDRYFDGGWVKYALTFVLGMGFERFVITPGDFKTDALVISVMVGLCALVLANRYLLSR